MVLKLSDKPKTLSPTLRSKHRYIAYKVKSERELTYDDLVNSIWHSVMNFLGELGASKTNLWVIKNTYNEKNKTGLIRCDHTQVEQVRASLALIQRIGDVRVIINVLGVSGTIKAARKKFFNDVDLKDFTQ